MRIFIKDCLSLFAIMILVASLLPVTTYACDIFSPCTASQLSILLAGACLIRLGQVLLIKLALTNLILEAILEAGLIVPIFIMFGCTRDCFNYLLIFVLLAMIILLFTYLLNLFNARKDTAYINEQINRMKNGEE